MTWRNVRAGAACAALLVGLLAMLFWHWWLGLVLITAGMLTLLKWGP